MAFPSDNRAIAVNRRHGGTRASHTPGKGECGNFLSFRFDSIHAYDIETVTGRVGELDLPALTEQARHFLDLYDKQLDFGGTGNKYHDVALLTEAVNNQIEEFSVELAEIENEESRREFIAYNVMDGFDTSVIYFLPIKILECVNSELREILLDFFAFLLHYGMFSPPKSSYEMCFAMNWDDCEEKYDDMCDVSPEYKVQTDRYLLGDINAFFETMENKRKLKLGNYHLLAEDVREGMERYKDGGGREYYTLPNGQERLVSELFEVIEEGLSLHMEDSLANYDIIPIRNDLGDEYFLEEYGGSDDILFFGSIFLFSYGMDDDEIVKNTIETFNNNDSSMNCPVLVDVARIGRCEDKIQKSDYPERWEEWYKRIISLIYE